MEQPGLSTLFKAEFSFFSDSQHPVLFLQKHSARFVIIHVFVYLSVRAWTVCFPALNPERQGQEHSKCGVNEWHSFPGAS